MKKYKPYLTRVDLVKNQVERERIQEQEAKRIRKQRIQEQNRQNHLRYQEQLRSEMAARYFHAVQSTGGESFSNTRSLLFDGIDDYVDCGNFSAYDTGDLSCSIWVYKTTSNDIERFISNSGSSSIAGFDIVMDRYGNINVIRNTRTSDTAIGYTAIGFTINTWHHISFTYNDSTRTLKMYLDGVLKNTSTGTTSTNSASITN